MLNLNHRTKIIVSKEIGIATGYTVPQEGMALIQAFENGDEKCLPAAGAGGEILLGFSYHETRTPLVKSRVESKVCPASAPYTIALTSTPLTGQLSVVNDVPTVQAAGNPANANEYSIAANVMTFHAGQAGLTIKTVYRYSPTVNELMFDDKVSTTTWDAPQAISSTGVIQSGEVFTDMFDAGVNWDAATAVKLDAGGLLTDQTGGGVTVACTIINIPTEELPYLGIRFSAI